MRIHVATDPIERAFLQRLAGERASFADVHFVECPTCGRTDWMKSEGQLAEDTEPTFHVEEGGTFHNCPACDFVRQYHFDISFWALNVAQHQLRLAMREMAGLKARLEQLERATAGSVRYGATDDPRTSEF